MTNITTARTRLALLALALGGFGIGATEFVAMGVLPQIAQNLLPELWVSNQHDAIAQAGLLISAYAAGVVVGAPTIAAGLARFPRKRLLVGFAIAFTIGTMLSAMAPTFELAVVARFAAGLPHGAYFGIAALVAADLMGPGKRGQGVALVLSGLTIANVVGVPLITWVGQLHGWRASYWLVAAIFALAVVAIQLAVPTQPGNPHATFRRELGALRRGQVWFALGIGSIGFGGFFAVYSYIAPLTTEVTGLPEGAVPWVLVVLGLGMTIGNLIGGRLADLGSMKAIFIAFPFFIASLVALALTSSSAAGLFIFGFLVMGTSAALSPGIQTRLMDVAGESQTLAAAINHSSLNIGNSLGAALGAAVIAAGLGYVAPTWVGVALAVAGFLLAVVAVVVERRRRASRGTTMGDSAGRAAATD
mgnify:FL=1